LRDQHNSGACLPQQARQLALQFERTSLPTIVGGIRWQMQHERVGNDRWLR
jgi:hypothetical protein